MLDVAESFCDAARMPARTVEAPPERWKIIGDFIVRTREGFESDQQRLVKDSGVSQSVISKLENGRPDNNRVTAAVLRKISLTLCLHPEALEQMAIGIDPTEVLAQGAEHWEDVENAGGFEAFYDAERGQPHSRGIEHTLARVMLRLGVIEERLGIDPDAELEALRLDQRRGAPLQQFDDSQFAVAAEKGELDTEVTGEVVKPPAESGFDPDED